MIYGTAEFRPLGSDDWDRFMVGPVGELVRR
jgi:hypothetical protein